MPSSAELAAQPYLVVVQEHPETKAKAKRLSLDIISTLPIGIIETILCLVPIKDAVRTSILSKKWRYNWTTIPKLKFDGYHMFVDKSSDGNHVEQTSEEPPNENKYVTRRCKVFNAINQVLLMHQGPIHEFKLSMDADETSVELDQIITHLSSHKNTIKKFKLKFPSCCSLTNIHAYMYSLPLSLFSLHQLTELHLYYCDFNFEQTFSGFANLKSLYLNNVNTSGKTLLCLVSSCPLLKRFSLLADVNEVYWRKDVTIAEIFNCIPMIEHLSVSCSTMKHFAAKGFPRKLPTPLVHLKYLYLEHMSFFDKLQLTVVGRLIRSFPNLEKIEIQILCDEGGDYDESDINSAMLELEEYSDIWLEHLNDLEIHGFSNLKPQVEFVKVILAKSPVLKRVMIVLEKMGDFDEMLEMLRILLRSPHASPTVDITVETRYEYRLRLGLVTMQS